MKKYKLKTPISGINELVQGNYYVCNEESKVTACIIRLQSINDYGKIYANGIWFDNNKEFTGSLDEFPYSTLNDIDNIRPATKEEIEKYFPNK